MQVNTRATACVLSCKQIKPMSTVYFTPLCVGYIISHTAHWPVNHSHGSKYNITIVDIQFHGMSENACVTIISPQLLLTVVVFSTPVIGSAIFTNITNVTTCLGSPAVFTCVITESLPILWLINGTPVQSPPPTTPLTPGPGSQSTLSVNATKELNGTSVQCYYTPSVLLPSIVSPPAYLSVQGL